MGPLRISNSFLVGTLEVVVVVVLVDGCCWSEVLPAATNLTV